MLVSLRRIRRPPPWALGGLLFAGAAALYGLTSAPTITWRHQGADGADLVAAVASGGIPHPTGYPTYLLLGQLISALLPTSDPARPLVLLSVVSAAAAVALVSLTTWELLNARQRGEDSWLPLLGAGLSGVSLAAAPLLWSQATIVEVYATNAAFVAVAWWFALRWRWAGGDGVRWLAALALLLGLGLGNHLTLALALPGLLLAGGRRPTISASLLALGLFGAGLSSYLLLPVRAATEPPLQWGEPTTLGGFWWLVSGELYRPFLFALPIEHLASRLSATVALLLEQFTVLGVALGCWGWILVLRRQRTLALALLLTFLLYALYAIAYNTTDSQVYLLPALLVFAIALGYGFAGLLRALPSAAYRELLGGISLLGLPLWSLLSNYSLMDLSHDRSARLWTEEALTQQRGPTLILADTDPRLFALWYGRYALDLGPQVDVVSPGLLPYAWYHSLLRRQDPHLALPPQEGPFNRSLLAFLEANAQRYDLWATSYDPHLATSLLQTERGGLWRLTLR